MPKKLEGYCSGHRRQYNPYCDHQLRLWYATLEERSQPPGAYIFYTTYLFRTIFLINLLLPSGYALHTPPFFYFHDPSSRLHFATPTHDSISQLTFVTPIHDSFFHNYPVL